MNRKLLIGGLIFSLVSPSAAPLAYANDGMSFEEFQGLDNGDKVDELENIQEQIVALRAQLESGEKQVRNHETIHKIAKAGTLVSGLAFLGTNGVIVYRGAKPAFQASLATFDEVKAAENVLAKERKGLAVIEKELAKLSKETPVDKLVDMSPLAAKESEKIAAQGRIAKLEGEISGKIGKLSKVRQAGKYANVGKETGYAAGVAFKDGMVKGSKEWRQLVKFESLRAKSPIIKSLSFWGLTSLVGVAGFYIASKITDGDTVELSDAEKDNLVSALNMMELRLEQYKLILGEQS